MLDFLMSNLTKFPDWTFIFMANFMAKRVHGESILGQKNTAIFWRQCVFYAFHFVYGMHIVCGGDLIARRINFSSAIA